ncbi:Uncharacterised protein [Klebsiella pneumoniae]|nr:Uncharacterised protein [Klebsiella pneumoniae]
MLKKLSLIIPLLALIALLIWWFTPHYTEEDEAYYRAVFCIIDHDDSRQFLHDMQNIVEGGNSDYALHKTHYLPALGQRMLDTWRQLSRRNSRRCVRTSSAAARYCAKNNRGNHPDELAKLQHIASVE